MEEVKEPVYQNNDNAVRITIIDEITGIEGHGTVVFVEPDDEIEDFAWLYCVSDNQEMNTQFEPKLGIMIWRVIESISPYYKIEEGVANV